MQPVGPLMREHRLIEKMVSLLRWELDRLRRGEATNPRFLEDAADFFRVYADRTHHGKEERILFRELARRELSAEHRRALDVLVEEHGRARALVLSLAAGAEAARRGDEAARGQVVDDLAALVELYPLHIAKEDAGFFFPAMGYFTPAEQEAMLREFAAFDQEMIHECFRAVVDRWSGK